MADSQWSGGSTRVGGNARRRHFLASAFSETMRGAIDRRRKRALANTETHSRFALEVVSHQKDALTIFHQPNYITRTVLPPLRSLVPNVTVGLQCVVSDSEVAIQRLLTLMENVRDTEGYRVIKIPPPKSNTPPGTSTEPTYAS